MQWELVLTDSGGLQGEVTAPSLAPSGLAMRVSVMVISSRQHSYPAPDGNKGVVKGCPCSVQRPKDR